MEAILTYSQETERKLQQQKHIEPRAQQQTEIWKCVQESDLPYPDILLDAVIHKNSASIQLCLLFMLLLLKIKCLYILCLLIQISNYYFMCVILNCMGENELENKNKKIQSFVFNYIVTFTSFLYFFIWLQFFSCFFFCT